jgi:hypothetical protein
MIGLDAMATELSLPADVEPAREFLMRSEVERVKTPRDLRYRQAVEQVRHFPFKRLQFRGEKFDGRSFELEVPELGREAPFNAISVRQGLNAELVNSLKSVAADIQTDVDNRSRPYMENARIKLESDDKSACLTYGELFFSEVTLKRVDEIISAGSFQE